MTALVALNVAFVTLITFPLWLGLAFTAVAGLALFFAVREVFLWMQYLVNLRAGTGRTGQSGAER